MSDSIPSPSADESDVLVAPEPLADALEPPEPAGAKKEAPPADPAPAFARYVLAGVSVAFLAAIADAIVGLFRSGTKVPPGAYAEAMVHLVALLMPAGLVAGAAAGTAITLWSLALPELKWPRPFQAAPDAFAKGMSSLMALGVFAGLTLVTIEHFGTRYHDAALAATAATGAVIGMAFVAATIGAAFLLVLRPLAKRMGRSASIGSLALLMLGVSAGVVTWAFVTFPGLLVAYPPGGIAIGASAVLLLPVLAWRFKRIRPRRTWIAAASATALTLAGLAFSGAFYGHDNRVRHVVEQRAHFGRAMVRRYASATDRDGDGHSFAFGGDDCDDSRADVFPGAPDPEGDGVDADCFDGDGSRDVSDLGDGRYAGRPTGMPQRPNILLLTIDTLRPDHLGCAGYERETSPNMDRFCEEAVVFEETLANSSRSLRSIPSMLTGKYPSQLDWGPEFLWPTLEESNETIAEMLGRRGYQTSVVMGTDYFERVRGFFQGFDQVDQSPTYKPPRHSPVDDGLRELSRLEGRGSPWLLWVHLFNVHQPYLRDNVESRFGDDLMDQYDTEIALADAQIQRILTQLDSRDLWEETVVVIASDHGEAFEEHGHFGHSTTLYGEELRATMMIRAPGFEPQRIEQRVGLLDLAPTLMNLANVEMDQPVPGRSLVPLMTGEREWPSERYLFAELMPDGHFPFDVKAVYQGDEKLMYWVRDGTFQLFDLSTDPTEHEDLSDARSERAEELVGVLRAWTSQTHRPENNTAAAIAHARLGSFPRMGRRLDLDFASTFRAVGVDIEPESVRAGESFKVTLYYDVFQETSKDLQFLVDLLPPEGYTLPPHFHGNHFPVDGRYKTFQWRAGEKLKDIVEIVVPRSVRRGITMPVRLTVLDNHHPIPFTRPDGTTGFTADIGEIRIQ